MRRSFSVKTAKHALYVERRICQQTINEGDVSSPQFAFGEYKPTPKSFGLLLMSLGPCYANTTTLLGNPHHALRVHVRLHCWRKHGGSMTRTSPTTKDTAFGAPSVRRTIHSAHPRGQSAQFHPNHLSSLRLCERLGLRA